MDDGIKSFKPCVCIQISCHMVLINMLVRAFGAPANLDDFNNVFGAFKSVEAKNRLPMDEGPIIGHLVKHRVFEDSKLYLNNMSKFQNIHIETFYVFYN